MTWLFIVHDILKKKKKRQTQNNPKLKCSKAKWAQCESLQRWQHPLVTTERSIQKIHFFHCYAVYTPSSGERQDLAFSSALQIAAFGQWSWYRESKESGHSLVSIVSECAWRLENRKAVRAGLKVGLMLSQVIEGLYNMHVFTLLTTPNQ